MSVLWKIKVGQWPNLIFWVAWSLNSNKKHIQTFVKVNVPVDKGIKDLIEALSKFPHLQAIESCENIGNETAWICFRYGSHWEYSGSELINFIFKYLGPKMINKLGDRVHISVSLREERDVIAEITVRAGAMNKTIKTVKQIYHEFQSCKKAACFPTSSKSLIAAFLR